MRQVVGGAVVAERTIGEVAIRMVRVVQVEARFVSPHVSQHDARRVGRRVEERHTDQVLELEAVRQRSERRPVPAEVGEAALRQLPVAPGRSATRINNTISSPTRAAPALIVEMTSIPGWEGRTSAG